MKYKHWFGYISLQTVYFDVMGNVVENI